MHSKEWLQYLVYIVLCIYLNILHKWLLNPKWRHLRICRLQCGSHKTFGFSCFFILILMDDSIDSWMSKAWLFLNTVITLCISIWKIRFSDWSLTRERYLCSSISDRSLIEEQMYWFRWRITSIRKLNHFQMTYGNYLFFLYF